MARKKSTETIDAEITKVKATILANEILFRFGRFHRGICG